MSEYCKILIVDDEFIMRQGIKHMLDWEQEGFQIIGEASSCQEALEIIETNIPHIIISDIVMPQVDGIEFTKIVQEKYPQIQIVILSSYSDFEYVRSSFQNGAVDYVLKPSLKPLDFLDTLKKIAKKISSVDLPSKSAVNIDNLLNRLILGYDIDFEHLNKLFINPCFCIFGINAKKVYPNYEERQKLLSSLISEIDLQDFKEEVTQVTNIENDMIVLIINFKRENYTNVENKLIKISNDVASKFREAFFGLSKEFYNIENIKEIYETDFLLLTQQYFYNKNINLLSSKSLKKAPEIEKFNFKGFSELVSILKIPKAFEMLTEYINKVINNKALTEFELKTLIQNCFYNVISTLEYLNSDGISSNSLKRECFDKIDSSKYAEDLMEAYQEILDLFNKIIDKQESNINSHMLNKIIQYIYDHYDEQLTLSYVSKLFNFNYYYLSSYFSSHNEEGFNEFLNKIRIKKACEFLQKDIPISDISSMVGYSDQSYFSKVFKKFTGVTPSNFRKNSIKGLS
ncbi:two-component system response regulator YesN [Clostridium saccharoperbutylacetonicum]|uniref:Stage 0 sporulation protein A homolog n=1 Tax=Clostridium saccharoperbutylacetonicum N1-4(HMT) TaxID=931276 RepID=M1LP31_9CLOT|nr:response regulator [Clostridium saccharoperbutylacetonicum]AGF54600.1 response regulator [Clostridium saccharoperbutylacetonicum N1-4(HMT)]NRT58879.1 two-component system response regulator YesN [Clostridium saccharoperbutylacetonicum]NSB28068.1 two-component system response regulator YesN [Clostridium saccharoperbutylacetonicum]NSB41554.1 two-component system response regulator YesN [Clostridium saccharoperbutylacetonicum]